MYSPIRDLFREINGADDGVWRDQVERLLDLRQFITLVAIEVYLSEWDGLTGNWAMNNFQLYRHGGSSVQLLLPWDRDRAMTQLTGDMPIFFRTDDNVLFHRAIAYTDLRELYLTVLEQCAQAAVQDDWFQNAVARSREVSSLGRPVPPSSAVISGLVIFRRPGSAPPQISALPANRPAARSRAW